MRVFTYEYLIERVNISEDGERKIEKFSTSVLILCVYMSHLERRTTKIEAQFWRHYVIEPR